MSNIKLQVNSNATKQMQSLINKIDTFPNRIASIQQTALSRSVGDIYTSLYRISRAADHIDMQITESGRLGYKLTIGPQDQKRGGKNSSDAYYAALIFIKGRSGGQKVRRNNGKMMRLRDESVRQGYPKFLKEIKLSSMPNNESKIKQESREIILKNLEYAIKRFGFGPRGGAPADLQDLPKPRSRAGKS